VALTVEHLPSKHKALSSNPSVAKIHKLTKKSQNTVLHKAYGKRDSGKEEEDCIGANFPDNIL
jgi:hypothetical protein